MKPKKNIENPFYSIPLKDLQDIIHYFTMEAIENNRVMYPTKNRIDEVIKVLKSKMQ